MVYYIIACHKEDKQCRTEQDIEAIVKNQVLRDGGRNLGEVFSLTESVIKTEFKVGSLDQLMELMDSFSKTEVQLDNSCKRNEKVYYDMSKELDR